MSKKTPGQILLAKLEAEAAEIHAAVAEAELAAKLKSKALVVAAVVEDVVEDIAEEIVDDSSLLIKKVKAFLPSRQSAFHVLKIIAYWEAAKLILEFVL
jgi:hypothetical protein